VAAAAAAGVAARQPSAARLPVAGQQQHRQQMMIGSAGQQHSSSVVQGCLLQDREQVAAATSSRCVETRQWNNGPAQLLASYLHQHVAVQSLVEQQPHSSKHGDNLRQQTQQPNTACVASIHTRTCRVGKAQSDTRAACDPLHACRLPRRGIAARSAALLLLPRHHRAACSWWRRMHSSRSALAGTACNEHKKNLST
jgi:hypothetical protein